MHFVKTQLSYTAVNPPATVSLLIALLYTPFISWVLLNVVIVSMFNVPDLLHYKALVPSAGNIFMLHAFKLSRSGKSQLFGFLLSIFVHISKDHYLLINIFSHIFKISL